MSPAPVLAEVAAAHRNVCRAIADLARVVTDYVDQVADRDFRFMGEEIGAELHVSRHKGDRMISRVARQTLWLRGYVGS